MASLLLLAVVASSAGCQMFRPRAPLHPDNPAGSWHLVQEGETLADLAGRAGVPIEDLEEINGIGRGEALTPGRLIYLLDPGALTAPSAPVDVDDARDEAVATTGSLRWPLREPKLSSPFGDRYGRPHEGIDLAAPIGTPIFAADGGYVIYAGDAVRGYGNMVVLQHAEDLLTVYAHNSVLLVNTGDRIAAGQEIARVGQSGRATAPHLHFEVRKRQVPHDPLRFLPALRP